jgi:hypothetical protein
VAVGSVDDGSGGGGGGGGGRGRWWTTTKAAAAIAEAVVRGGSGDGGYGSDSGRGNSGVQTRAAKHKHGARILEHYYLANSGKNLATFYAEPSISFYLSVCVCVLGFRFQG